MENIKLHTNNLLSNRPLDTQFDAIKNVADYLLGDHPGDATPYKIDDSCLAQRIEDFCSQVLLPVCERIPAEVEMQTIVSEYGPVVCISHKSEFLGERYNYIYHIVLHNGGTVQSSDIPRDSSPNIIWIPISTTPEGLIDAQNTLRRMFISDPYLNPRFTRRDAVLEPFQHDAKKAILNDFDQKGSALIEMATGTGKTLVAFAASAELLNQAHAQGKKPAVVFLLDNLMGLEEARDKLKLLFGNHYSASQIYESLYDDSGDFIFATPSSLDETGRIEKLLQNREIACVIFDEAHHIVTPGNSIIRRRFLERSEEVGSSTKILGLTATTIRTDENDVLSPFGGTISFHYSIQRAWEEGYLVRLNFTSGDLDLNPDNHSPLESDSKLQEHYNIYGNCADRYPHLLELYHQYAGNSKDPRTLIIAPHAITYATTLAEFFNNPKKCNFEAVPTVALTSAQRSRKYNYFKDHYEAWKQGSWPDNSEFIAANAAKEPKVPKVVVSVKIFQESIDVPGIRTIILWGDTDSTLSFIQRIGRGLRPAPYKNILNVIDAGGILRNKAHIPFITSLMSPIDSCKDSFNFGVFLDDASQAIFDRYETDIPSRLLEIWPDYRTLLMHAPPEALQALDDYISCRGFFIDQAEMKDFMRLYTDNFCDEPLNVEQIETFRERFVPCFYSIEDYTTHDKLIPNTDRAKLLFARIQDLLAKSNSSQSQQIKKHIYEMFPDFHPNLLQQLRNRAANLAFARKKILGVTRVNDVPSVLVKDVIDKRLTDIHSAAAIFILTQQIQVQNGNPALALLNAEASFDMRVRKYQSSSNIGNDNLSDSIAQSHLIKLFLAHPKFRSELGQLNEIDFNLDHKSFIETANRLRLCPLEDTTTFICASVIEFAEKYLKNRSKRNRQTDENIGAQLLDYMNPVGLSNLVLTNVTTTQVKKLNLLRGKIDSLGLLGEIDPELAAIKAAFDPFMTALGIRYVVSNPISSGCIVLERSQSSDLYQLSAVNDLKFLYRQVNQALEIEIKPDITGRPHVFIEGTGNTSLEKFYARINARQQKHFVDTLLLLFKNFEVIYGSKIVFVIGQNKGKTKFMQALFESMINDSGFDVLGRIDLSVLNGSQDQFDSFDLKTLQASNLSFLQPPLRIDTRLMDSRGLPLRHYKSRLATAYQHIYYYNLFKNNLEQIQRASQVTALSSPLNVAWQQSLMRVNSLVDVSLGSAPDRKHIARNLSRFFELLNLGNPLWYQNELSIAFATLYEQIVSRIPFHKVSFSNSHYSHNAYGTSMLALVMLNKFVSTKRNCEYSAKEFPKPLLAACYAKVVQLTIFLSSNPTQQIPSSEAAELNDLIKKMGQV